MMMVVKHDDVLLYPGDDDGDDDIDDVDDDDDDGEQQEEVGQQDLRDDDPGPAASLPQPVTLDTVVTHFSEPGQSILKSCNLENITISWRILLRHIIIILQP